MKLCIDILQDCIINRILYEALSTFYNPGSISKSEFSEVILLDMKA